MRSIRSKHRVAATALKQSGQEKSGAPRKRVSPDSKHVSSGKKSGRSKEQKVYGVHACLSVHKLRPEAIIRAYVTEKRLTEVGELLRALATNKKAYHVVTSEEMDRICESSRHEGVCLLINTKPQLSSREFLERLGKSKSKASAILFIDGVGNPHNLGAMMRSMAHFGAEFLVINGIESHGLTSGALARIAEGGAECVTMVQVQSPDELLSELVAKGYRIIGTSSHQGTPLFTANLPQKSVIIMGSEGKGISGAVAKLCRDFVRIPGTGAVESLNVSVAAALLLGRYAHLWGEFSRE